MEKFGSGIGQKHPGSETQDITVRALALPGPIGNAGVGSVEQQWRPSLVVSAFHSPV
jgi:hypothetical protein